MCPLARTVPVITATRPDCHRARSQLIWRGRRPFGAVVLVSFGLALQGAGWADPDVDGYLLPPAIGDEHEARIQRERIVREIEAAREAAHREAEALAREQKRNEQELAERPPAVQLIEARCANCHEDDTIFAKGRSRLGWEAVVLRMKWLNGADLKSGERPVIASWLATEYGVPAWQTASELLALFGSTVAAVWVARTMNARRTRERKP